MEKEKIGVFVGSFDPFTVGHDSVVTRSLGLFDRLVIGVVGDQVHKPGMAPAVERMKAIQELYANNPQIEVKPYYGLAVDFAKEQGAHYIIKGVRSVKDFEYEREQADVNRQISGIETILLFAEPQYASVSSTVVRELKHFGRDVSKFLPLFLLSFILFVCSCGTTKKQAEEQSIVNIEFNADSAFQFCAAQCSFGPRTMNSEAHEQCAQWIQQKFQQYGYQVEMQKADLKGYDGTILKSTNIIAHSPLTSHHSPLTKLLICAHWDSRPWADNDPDSANWRKPVMAANDGASGVAVMLELARLIQQHDSLNVAVDFICFDAEDWGIPQWDEKGDGSNSWALGSQYWAKTLNSQLSTLNYNYAILLDMVGGQGAKFYQEAYSLQKAGQIVDKVWRAANAAGYGSIFPKQEGGYVTDDHVSVNEIAQIPCIDIINYYPDCKQSSFGPTWHTINDDLQHIDKNTLQAVGQTLVQVLFSE